MDQNSSAGAQALTVDAEGNVILDDGDVVIARAGESFGFAPLFVGVIGERKSYVGHLSEKRHAGLGVVSVELNEDPAGTLKDAVMELRAEDRSGVFALRCHRVWSTSS